MQGELKCIICSVIGDASGRRSGRGSVVTREEGGRRLGCARSTRLGGILAVASQGACLVRGPSRTLADGGGSGAWANAEKQKCGVGQWRGGGVAAADALDHLMAEWMD